MMEDEKMVLSMQGSSDFEVIRNILCGGGGCLHVSLFIRIEFSLLRTRSEQKRG